MTVISGWLASVCRSRGERRWGKKKKRTELGVRETQERQGREATPVLGLFPDGHEDRRLDRQRFNSAALSTLKSFPFLLP